MNADFRADLLKRGFGVVPVFAKRTHDSAYRCITHDTASSALLHDVLTTVADGADNFRQMARPARIYKGKQPHRFHCIPEWAERRGVSQADIMRGVGADKGTVSRWFDGTLPMDKHLIALAGFLEAGEVAALFRHPDDDWMSRHLRGRSHDERQRMQAAIEALITNAFPRKKEAA